MEKNIRYIEELAERAAEDEQAFTELYTHFFPRIYKFLMSKTNDAEASNKIISKTFFEMYDRLSEYDSEKNSFSEWIFSIAANELKLFFRLQDDELNFVASEYDEPEKKFLCGEENEKIRAALEKLSELELKIVEMNYWMNYSPQKIADILEMTPKKVNAVLEQAKIILKKYLEGVE